MTRKTNSSAPRTKDGARGTQGVGQDIEFRVDLSDAEFEIQFGEAVLRQSPDYIDVLRRLGHLLTEQGHYHRGLELDQRLVVLLPADPVAHYNLACSYSLTGRLREAIGELKKAVELGYHDFAHMEVDDDLDNLRPMAEFQELLEDHLGADQGPT